MRKLVLFLLMIGVLLLIAAGVFVFWYFPEKIRPMQEYRAAVALYEKGDYVPAALQFEAMRGLANSKEYAGRAWIAAGDRAFEEGDLAQARTYYLKGGADNEVFEKLDSAYYQNGVRAYAENSRVEGENCFSCISEGSRYRALLDPVRLSCAERFLEAGDLDSADKVLLHCGNESAADICELWMKKGESVLHDYDLDTASDCFAKAMAISGERESLQSRISALWHKAGDNARADGNTELANKCYARMGGASSAEQTAAYAAALTALGEGRSVDALRLFTEAGDFRDAAEQADRLRESLKHYYATGLGSCWATLAPDGKATPMGNWGTYNDPGWYSMTAIALGANRFMLGLREDGTVAAHGDMSTANGLVSGWRGVLAVACGAEHSVALRQGGTVYACGLDRYGEVSGTYSWTHVTAIAAGRDFTAGLKDNGKVVLCGRAEEGFEAAAQWEGVSAIACGERHVLALMPGGTVVAAGENAYGECEVAAWTDIVAIFAGAHHSVGLRADGTLAAAGSNMYGECSVTGITGVISVACGDGFTLILTENGEEIRLGIGE